MSDFSPLKQSISQDRWLEMELSWFDPARLDAQVSEFFDRLSPLWLSVSGKRGVIFSFSLRMHLLMQWSGDPDQLLPFDEPIRYANWKGMTYGFLRDLLRRLRVEAGLRGFSDLQFGLLFLGGGANRGGFGGGGHLYEDSVADWFDQHPEVYLWDKGTGPHDPLRVLHADSVTYASQPSGIPEGLVFADFFAAQWGSLSRFLWLDAVVLRDGFIGPMKYCRSGPHGPKPAKATEIDYWTEGVRRIFRAVKDANPEVWVIGYSSAASPVGEWLVGCCDLERVVADGAMDAFISQTWAGAWQDFWSDTMLGWTFQLSNLLAHQAQLEGGSRKRSSRCRLYQLADTWDSFEPYDTLHKVPRKLVWGMWAFSHAALRTPEGLVPPQGVYLSWVANRFSEIWSPADVEFLGSHLDAAHRDAQELEEVFGPELVFDRAAAEAIVTGHPGENVAAFADEQTGLLNKWGFGCLSAARAEDVHGPRADGRLWQIPPPGRDPTAFDGPVILAGRADVIDSDLLQKAGIKALAERLPAGFEFFKTVEGRVYPDPVFSPDRYRVLSQVGEVLVETLSAPLLVRSKDGGTFYWQPQDWMHPGNNVIRQSHLGSFRPYQVLANAFHRALRDTATWHREVVAIEQTIAIHVWRSAGCVKVLVGNLETGVIGDARHPREVTVVLHPDRLGLGLTGPFVLKSLDETVTLMPEPSGPGLRFTIHLGSEDSQLFTLHSSL